MLKKIVIIGGGASGVFASLRASELVRNTAQVVVLESTSRFLKKVKISGGGRCNVTHHLFEVRDFCSNYPRGQKELHSPFHTFQAADTVEWFKKRGIELKHESDGRMFPVTDHSQTIIDCFLHEAERLGVQLKTNRTVIDIEQSDCGKFILQLKEAEPIEAVAVLIATGSSPGGYKLATKLGHTLTDLAPSLFSFKINDPIINGLSGISFSSANLALKISGSKDFKQSGPLLITHWGLSGPALLKLSAWAAREMKKAEYRATLVVNWLASPSIHDVEKLLRAVQSQNGKSLVANVYPEKLSKRFWQQVLVKCGLPLEKRWAEVSKKEFNLLVRNLYACELRIDGKNRYKDEFVECGGVQLKEINFKTMESKICSGLYFSGEVMDVDGITGGFNFQNAWTSGWLAGSHMAQGLLAQDKDSNLN